TRGSGLVSEPYDFVAAKGDPLERLDKFVVERLAAAGAPASRAAVQRWIALGRVTVDDKGAQASDRLKPGMQVHVAPLPPEPTALGPDASVPFEVLYEDPSLIVVDKPPGVVVPPARGHAEGTLVHGLIARGSFDRAKFEAEGEIETARPGIVHRL